METLHGTCEMSAIMKSDKVAIYHYVIRLLYEEKLSIYTLVQCLVSAAVKPLQLSLANYATMVGFVKTPFFDRKNLNFVHHCVCERH